MIVILTVYLRMMSDKLYQYRWLKQYLPNASSRRLGIMTGARQTGKTTLAKNIYPDISYINLDAPENRDSIKEISTFTWPLSIGNAVIDEAQKEPSVFEKVKYNYDSGKIDFTFFLGSSQILLLKHIRESLAGRVFIYELWPLMMSELLLSDGVKNPDRPLISYITDCSEIDSCLKKIPDRLVGETDDSALNAENYLLKWGGMPELLSLSENDRKQWLRSYLYTYLERDLSDLVRLNDFEPFKKLQRLSSLRSAKLLSYSELAKDAGISIDTTRRYLEYLRLSYQVFFLTPFYRNLTSRVVKSPKLYWVDIGLMRQLSGFHGTISGDLYETMVVSELFKWLKTTNTEAKISFYRTRSGLEVDIILELPSGIIGMEVKSREKVDMKDCRSMREVALKLGKEWLGGLCIYRGRRLFRLGEPSIWAVPSYRLFTAFRILKRM